MKLPDSMSRDATPVFVIRLPRFVLKRTIGAGDAATGLTAAMGISPCQRCHARSERMNRWAALTPRVGSERSGVDFRVYVVIGEPIDATACGPDDNRDFQDGYSKVTEWVARHDQSEDKSTVPPTVDELEGELQRALSRFSPNMLTSVQDDACVTGGASRFVSPPRQRRRITAQLRAAVVEAYESGQVARELALGRSTVLKILKAAGVTMRPQGGSG